MAGTALHALPWTAGILYRLGQVRHDSSRWKFINQDTEDTNTTRKDLGNTEETEDSENCPSEPEVNSNWGLPAVSSNIMRTGPSPSCICSYVYHL